MMIGGADDRRDRRHVAEHDEAEHHRPDDHRILIRHHDAGRREFQRAVDAQQRADRDDARPRQTEPRLPSVGVTQPNGDISAPSRNVPHELRRRQHDIGRRAQRARDQHQHRKRQAAAERDHRRPAHGLRRRTQRDQHAAEPDQDRAPAPPADALAQHDRRQRGDEDRRRQIIGDDVGERQIDGGEKERRDLERREQSPAAVAATAARGAEFGALPPDHRQQQRSAPRRRAATSIARPNRSRR